MSFSGKVKEELLEHYARARHCDNCGIVLQCSYVSEAFGSGVQRSVHVLKYNTGKSKGSQENALHCWKKRLI